MCLLLACLLLYDLARRETDDPAARRTVFYLLIAPASFFFSAVYTESLFLLCSVGVFYAVQRQWWGWAIVAALLAALTRAVGVLLWAVILWELARAWWSVRTRQTFFAYALVAACTLLIPLGLISFMAYNAAQFGTPTAFSQAQAAWGRTGFFTTNLFYELRQFFRDDWAGAAINVPSVLSLITLIGGAALIIPVWRRFGASYGVYTLVSWLIPIFSSTLYSQSLMRYASVIFPFFMLLGVWGRHEIVDRLITLTFPVLLGLLLAMFAAVIFVG